MLIQISDRIRIREGASKQVAPGPVQGWLYGGDRATAHASVGPAQTSKGTITIANVFGSDNSETLNADDGVTNNTDTIFGFHGNDTIFGFGGNDLIQGSAGADTIKGGSGTGTASYSDSTEGVASVEAHGDGIYESAGNGAADDDVLQFVGYCTIAEGATLQGHQSHWSARLRSTSATSCSCNQVAASPGAKRSGRRAPGRK